jgi:hypothetical protein
VWQVQLPGFTASQVSMGMTYTFELLLSQISCLLIRNGLLA